MDLKYSLIAIYAFAEAMQPASPLAIVLSLLVLFRLCLEIPVITRRWKGLVRWIKKNF
jgi:hypothetical protein